MTEPDARTEMIRFMATLPSQNFHALTVAILASFYVVACFALQPQEHIVYGVGGFILTYGGIEAGRFMFKRHSWKPEAGGRQEEEADA